MKCSTITDLYTTLAELGGADIPTDRAIDGIDQREFLLGRQEKSAREFIAVFQGRELYTMKWRNYKMHFVWQVRMPDVPQEARRATPHRSLCQSARNRRGNHRLESSVVTRGWVLHAMFAELAKLKATLAKDPLIPMGTLDPYLPPTTRLVKSTLELPYPSSRINSWLACAFWILLHKCVGPPAGKMSHTVKGFGRRPARARRTSSAGIQNPSHFLRWPSSCDVGYLPDADIETAGVW